VKIIFSSLILFLSSIIAFSQTDQELVWGSYFGGDSFESGTAILEIATGGFAVTGDTESYLGLSTFGAYQTMNAGSQDVFLARFDQNRNLIWSTYFGGPSSDNPFVMAQTSGGNIVIAGGTNSTSNIATPGAFQVEISGEQFAGFITKFSDIGFPIWSTYLAGSGVNNYVNDLLVLDNDDILVVGKTESNDFPVTNDALQSTLNGTSDGFITRFDGNGNLLWSTYFGGPGIDEIMSINVDSEGNFVLVGYTESASDIASTGAFQENYGGEGDAFILKLNSNGDILWSSYFGGPEMESIFLKCRAIFDNEDNFYISGNTRSTTNIATPGAYQTDFVGAGFEPKNIFLASFNSSGNLNWATYFGNNFSSVRSITKRANELVMLGSASLGADVLLGNPMLPDFPGSNWPSVFITSFSLLGEPLWGTYYGGTANEHPISITTFSDNTIAITGSTSSQSGIATSDGYDTQINGGPDAFIAFFQINYNTGVDENEVLPMSVFPNPSSGAVRLQLPPSFSFMADVEVYDLAGRVVKSQQNFNSFDSFTLNVPAGMYVVVCRNGEKVARTKVVVE
jgi:hypothetical protein